MKSDKFHISSGELVPGKFIERLNRFVVKVQIGQEIVLAHLPNPGRLWELLLPNVTVLIEKSNIDGSKFGYSVIGVMKNNSPILLHTIRTNAVAKWLLQNNIIEELRDFETIVTEKIFNNSRFDFYLSNKLRSVYLEVKSCTLFYKTLAMFPDAITTRGRRHLIELANLKNTYEEGVVLFLIHNPSVKYFLPEYHTDLEFSKTFYQNRHKIKYLAYSIEWDNSLSIDPSKIKKVNIPLYILKNELDDKGAYILLIENQNDQKIKIGNLGEIFFQKGFYCYVGSAMKNLTQRINRHKRKNKNVHWHIDYLLQHSKIIKSIEIRSHLRIECELALNLSRIANGEIDKFGSSDCTCKSHLFYFISNPLQNEKFVEVILDFRIRKLIDKYNLI